MPNLLRPSCYVCGALVEDALLEAQGLVTDTGDILPWPDETPDGYEEVPLCASCLAAFLAWSRRTSQAKKGT